MDYLYSIENCSMPLYCVVHTDIKHWHKVFFFFCLCLTLPLCPGDALGNSGGVLLEILTLFQTIISDFPRPISDLKTSKKLRPVKETYPIPDLGSRQRTNPYMVKSQTKYPYALVPHTRELTPPPGLYVVMSYKC